jgi:iron complex outermembrane receptor protein
MTPRRTLALCIALFWSGRAAAQDPPPDPAPPPPAEAPPAEAPPAEPAPGEPAPAPPGPPPLEVEEDVVTPAAAPPDTGIDEITVTGSLIRRKDLTTPAPVTIMTRAQFEQSGKLTIADFLQSMPEQGNAPNFQLNNGGATYGADGATRVSLRSLGVTRTLVLLNGRRMVNSGLGASAAVDLNSIPAAAVERIEVLKDGGSAIYGSDAVAGVVNVITRRNFNGSEISGQYGISGHGDAGTLDLNAVTGRSGSAGSFLFSAGYFDQQVSWLRDRDFSKQALTYDYAMNDTISGGSFRTPQGTISLPADADGNPLPACLANDLCRQLVMSNPNWATDAYIRDESAPLGWRIMGDADTYNFAEVNYLTIPSNRLQVFSSGDTKTSSGSLRGYYEASYVHRESQQNAAPMPLNPGDYTIGDGVTPMTVSADSMYNPFGVDLPFAGRRLVEFGNRTYTQDLGTFRMVLGVDGTLPESTGPLNGWRWDASVNYGRTDGSFTTDGAIRNSRVGAAVGPSMPDENGVPRCVSEAGNLATVIPGCVPINLFGGPNNGSIDPAQIENLGFEGTSRAFDSLLSLGATASGSLFELTAGRKASLALGYEFRRQEGAQIADPIAASGDSADFNFKTTEGDFNVSEAFAELSVPIVADVAGVKELEASLAGRYVNYDTFGSNFSYKLGARYTPVEDFTVRGTFSTAFRAPSISELYLGQGETAPTASDPCSDLSSASAELVAQCRATGVPAAGTGDQGMQQLAHVGGNAELDPETATIFTAGIVVQPRMVEGLSLTVDYYNVTVDDLIGTLGVPAIIAGCYPGAGGSSNQEYCALIARAPESGRILFVEDINQNVGELKTAGIDVAVRYTIRQAAHRIGLGVDANWLAYFDRTQSTGAMLQTIEGKGNFDLGALPALKANLSANWSLRGIGAGVIARFVSSFKECAAADMTSTGGLCYVEEGLPSRDTGTYVTLDLNASYSFASSAGRTSIMGGINNVTDKAPQFVYSAPLANSDPSVYDFLGRYFYIRMKQAF